MAYQELIKDFNTTRSVLRDFYVQGFHTRQDFRLKSLRSYDNERRRVESWLRDAMGFRQEPEGKVVFLTVDCRTVRHNPLYEAFRAKSFTPWDAALHFLLLDLFHRQGELSFAAVADQVCGALLQADPDCSLPDASTIRNKLKEGVELGIFCSRKVGKSLYYRLADAAWNPAGWSAALCFASEALPLGIVGAYLLDRCPEQEAFLSFKHHYLSGALDQEILCQLAAAHEEKRKVRLEFQKKEGKAGETLEVSPLKVYCSTATGGIICWPAGERENGPSCSAWTGWKKQHQGNRTQSGRNGKKRESSLSGICGASELVPGKNPGRIMWNWSSMQVRKNPISRNGSCGKSGRGKWSR